jgi:hypothetical protein
VNNDIVPSVLEPRPLRVAEVLHNEEAVEVMGLWRLARHTVCTVCSRYRLTNRQAVCRRCTTIAVQESLAAEPTHTEGTTHT